MFLKLFGNKINDLCIRWNFYVLFFCELNCCLNYLEYSDFIRVNCDFNGCLK